MSSDGENREGALSQESCDHGTLIRREFFDFISLFYDFFKIQIHGSEPVVPPPSGGMTMVPDMQLSLEKYSPKSQIC